MTKKRKYLDVNIPEVWGPYLKEALNDPEIQKSLELANQTQTISGLGAWIIRNFLVENTSFHFQHLNVKEKHITVIDNKYRIPVDIFLREPNELWCDHCKGPDCEHVRFALTIPEVRKTLTQKGWSLPDASS